MTDREKEVEKKLLENERQTLNKLKQSYTQALADVKTEVKRLQKDTELPSKIYQLQYQIALEEQISGIMQILNDGNITTVDAFLNEMYQDGYTGIMYSLQGMGVSLAIPIDQNLLIKAVTRDTAGVKLSTRLYNNVEAFKQFRLKFIDPQTNSEQSVPLSEIADIALADGAVKIDHENAQRYAVVQTNVRDRDLVGFVEEAKAKVNQSVKLPESYHLSWGGQFENQQRAAERLMIVVPISIAMIFFLLFSTFGSVKQALLVLANIPFAMIGGVFALFLANEYLSVPASVGFIALLGVAVLNGVVMVSYFNQLLENGLSLVDAVYQGAKRRLRPVMMTASIAAFGLVPMLFATGPGSEVQRPLAIVVIGGLITSTLLTLVLLPILFKKWGGN